MILRAGQNQLTFFFEKLGPHSKWMYCRRSTTGGVLCMCVVLTVYQTWSHSSCKGVSPLIADMTKLRPGMTSLAGGMR